MNSIDKQYDAMMPEIYYGSQTGYLRSRKSWD